MRRLIIVVVVVGLLGLFLVWPGKERAPVEPLSPGPNELAAEQPPSTSEGPPGLDELVPLAGEQSEMPKSSEAPIQYGTRFDYLGQSEDPFLSYHSFFEKVLAEGLLYPVDDLLAAGVEGDGEAAYALFVILHSCELLAPQSAKEAAAREHYLVERLAKDPDREEDWWDELSSASERHLEICSRWGPGETWTQAWEWLSRSAELGYFPAMQVYASAEGSFLPGRLALWGQTGRLEEYRSRVPYYLRRLLETGRPEALATVGYHYMSGALIPEDPAMAFAWMQAAVMAAELANYTSRMLDHLRLKLTPRELREASELAQEICRRYTDESCQQIDHH
ncbi:MAG: hypothetical protein R3200_05875 [Xanthomonadales bacterium]|nr:hypothetical protein [Xanthomonadales bacterium]